MKKNKPIIWIILFLSIIATPHVSYFFLGQYVDSENYENRNLIEKPVLTTENYKEYPQNYEQYYGDNIPYRNQLITLNNSLEYFVFKQSSNDSVVIGEEGWLFYCNEASGNPLEQSLGYSSFSNEELREIAKNLTLCKKSFEFIGLEFVIFVAPNKESIYIDKIPQYYEKKNEVSNAEQLIEYLKENTDIRIVYPMEILKQTRAENPSRILYHKLDTHWNNAGAYVGATCLAKELGLEMPNINNISCVPRYGNSGDLTNMLNISIKNGNIDYDLSGYSALNTQNIKWDYGTEIIYHTIGADNRKLFVYRDSFSSALAPYIASQFENSYFVHYNSYNQEQIFNYDADIFVLEMAERYVNQLKSFGISYVATNIETMDGKKNITISRAIPDVELRYVSISMTDALTGEKKTIQELENFSDDKNITVNEEDQGEITIYVFSDEKGEDLVNQTIIPY